MADGTVTNRLQSSTANYQIVENTATINHGSSGGPLVDDRGQVVGITTASDISSEQKNGINGGKFFFAVPSSVINDLLAANRVVPTTSTDQVVYNKALDLMRQSHYKAALKNLHQAQADGYNSPYLQERLDSANKAVAAGRDKPTSSSSPVSLIGIVGVGVVVLGIVVLLLARWRRGEKDSIPTLPAGSYAPAMAAGPREAWQPPQSRPEAGLSTAALPPPPAATRDPALSEPVWRPQFASPPFGPPEAERAVSPVTTAAGWYPDPSGRHQVRYWDGTKWSQNVSDDGEVSTEPA